MVATAGAGTAQLGGAQEITEANEKAAATPMEVRALRMEMVPAYLEVITADDQRA